MEKKNIVGNNIRVIRTSKGMTQEALALESGLSQGYVNQLENGKRLYTQKSLEMIADALDTPIIEFFHEEDIKPENKKTKKRDRADKKHYKKELLSLLSSMPEHIIEHYINLVKLEKKIIKDHQ
ncbi:MAG: helix-turn-helix transcriptional regulator [Syntrophaceae bacterium]|jgi:transcriptional regulator with XRE-family HTH domain|nr:helix-turn-helix transcriptional regulator [Syntrophaceae bacterium]MBP9650150.1 helix-turn-helix transcriptional regulator [Syntrophaceae bacterium]